MWQFYIYMHSEKFFPDHFFAILYLGSLFRMPFPNSKSLKNMRLLLLYQAIHACRNLSIAFSNSKNLKSMRMLLLYHAIHASRNLLITYLPINELYSFCRNCLTIFLPIYDINEKYPSYIPMISCHYCYSKLVGAFRDMAHHDVFYCYKAFMSSIYFAAIA